MNVDSTIRSHRVTLRPRISRMQGPHHAILSRRACQGCTLLRAQPFIRHDHLSIGEEDHDGDPATCATAVCPRAENARGMARLSPPDPGAQVPWPVARAAPQAGGPAVGVIAARARAAYGRRRTELVSSRAGS